MVNKLKTAGPWSRRRLAVCPNKAKHAEIRAGVAGATVPGAMQMHWVMITMTRRAPLQQRARTNGDSLAKAVAR